MLVLRNFASVAGVFKQFAQHILTPLLSTLMPGSMIRLWARIAM